MSLMQRLRAETADQHHQAENSPYEQALVQGRLPRELYVAGLAQRYAIHAELERQMLALRSKRPEYTTVIDESLFQSANAAADLRHFGIELSDLPVGPAAQDACAWLLELGQSQPHALLGANYVLEGSKNGARYIARAIQRAYQLTGPGLRYLDPHGEQQRPLWEAYRQKMDGLAFSIAEQDQIVAAAQRMFVCIGAIDREVSEAATPIAAR